MRSTIAMMLCLLAAGVQAAPLPQLNIKFDETSVSGLSSGGYMAVQFHVAHSSFVKGVGIVAAGPYYCAKDDQQTALTVCSCIGMPCDKAKVLQQVPSYVQVTKQNASASRIDATANLSSSRVWLFSGGADSVVPVEPVTALRNYYRNFMDDTNIAFEHGIPAEHAMPTDSFGGDCAFRGEPFINNCQYDAAGNLLKWIYGPLNPRNEGAPLGELIEFDQSKFIDNPTAHGMYPTGWAYVPAICRSEECRVHVAFHGCKQFPGWPYAAGANGKMGDTFARHAGYNQWADTNHIVVLYPQAGSLSTMPRPPRSNPTGCWDWWGYDDANYAVRSGHQMSAVHRMVSWLAKQPVQEEPQTAGFCGKASNAEHVANGRAHTFFFWWYYANGSGDYLGMSALAETTLQQTAPDRYQEVSVCPLAAVQ